MNSTPRPNRGRVLAALLVVLLLAMALWWVLAAPILVHGQEPEETQICAPGQPTIVAGDGPAGAPLLLVFAGRVVGGGATASDGRYRLTLVVGAEAPGRYVVAVERRGDHQVLRTLVCWVPTAEELRALRAASATPTASPSPSVLPATPVPAPPTFTPAPATTPLPTATSVPTALDYRVPPQTPTSGPDNGQAVAGVVVEALPDVAMAATATPALLAAPLTVRVGYDRNQNRTADLDEGVAGLTVYVADRAGRLLDQGLTDETGSASLTVRVAPGDTLTVTIPHFSAVQRVAAGAQPPPVLISAVAPLPALLP